MKHRIFALLLVITFGGQSFAQSAAVFSDVEKAIADGITVATIKDVTTALSADEMQGRGTMQPGGEKAANWLADRFQKLGLKPLGDKGSYLQKIDFKETVATPETTLKVGDESLAFGSDFALLPQNNGNKDISGDMVFIAYGMKTDVPVRDDMAGVDIKGKIVVMLHGPPAAFTKKVWDEQDASRIFTRYVISKGPAALG